MPVLRETPGGKDGQSFNKQNSYVVPVSLQARRFFYLYIYTMKIVILLCLIGFSFGSCKQSAVKQSFSSADSLVIHFKNEQAGEITKTVQTTEAKAIRRMIEFIDRKESELFKCGYDGKMFFYSKGQRIQEVDFKMKDEACNHFAFLLNEKLVSTRMSNEAVDFLDALEKGLPIYY